MAIITSSDLKTFLGIPDTVDDPLLISATAAANQYVVEYCGRVFDKTVTGSASARVYKPDDPCYTWTHDFWETSVLAVKVDQGNDGTFEETWVLNTDFYLEPLDGLLDGSPRPYYKIVALPGKLFPTWGYYPTWGVRPSVQVTAAWGWSAVPDPVKYATLVQAGRLFSRKDSPQGVIGGFADFTALRVSARIDPDVADLLAPFRHPTTAAPMVA